MASLELAAQSNVGLELTISVGDGRGLPMLPKDLY